MLVVVVLLTLSLSMYDGEFDHGGGSGGGGGPVAAVVEDIYWQKQPATKASTVT
jgi:hypothetical protein